MPRFSHLTNLVGNNGTGLTRLLTGENELIQVRYFAVCLLAAVLSKHFPVSFCVARDLLLDPGSWSLSLGVSAAVPSWLSKR